MSALAVSGAELEGKPVGLRAEEGLIVELGPGVESREGDEVLDADGLLLAPPMVNAHTHAAMTLFRGFGDDLPLMEWLRERIWPAEAKLDPADVYWGTRLAAIEMIRSGTTRFLDMYWHGPEVARAAADAGLRAVASAVLIDELDPAKGEGLRAEALESLERIGEFAPLVQPGVGPHAIYTVSGESLRWLGEIAAERELILQIHLSETDWEVADCLRDHAVRPAAYLDRLGVLSERAVLAHGVYLDDAELDLIAERGATVVANPAANMKLGVGAAFPYSRAAARGVRIALGTDGVASNSNLDLFEEVKLLALSQKAAAGDPAVLPAREALAIARGLRSGMAAGTPLAVGEPADFLLLRASDPELSVGDPTADLVYAANGSIVDSTVVAGRVLMRDRVVADAQAVVAEVRERAARLTA